MAKQLYQLLYKLLDGVSEHGKGIVKRKGNDYADVHGRIICAKA